jgi:septal ring-binding cell division protein DamX
MKGRTVGGLLTSGLVALAVALALLQAAVLAQASRPAPLTTNAPLAPSNRYSAPGGRAGIPWTPTPPAKAVPPSEREGRTPDQKPQREEHRAPLRNPNSVPHLGPRPPRRALA